MNEIMYLISYLINEVTVNGKLLPIIVKVNVDDENYEIDYDFMIQYGGDYDVVESCKNDYVFVRVYEYLIEFGYKVNIKIEHY